MRSLFFAFGIFTAAMGMGSPARAQSYPWCGYYDTGDQAVNCGFSTREQCMATVSGIGGFCMPNNQYQQPFRPAKRR